jgi:hypothetical protein
MAEPELRLEFRIPISPTGKFFAQVRFFNFALRRLEAAPYRDARICVVVGDGCDLDAVRRQNSWSENYNVAWERAPDEVFDEFHYWGTANWRLNLPADDADVVILSDADTVLLRDIDPLLREFPQTQPTLFGHVAHLPPHQGVGNIAPPALTPEFWPWLLGAFEIPWPERTYRYTMDLKAEWPVCPAYFNLGFLALNREAVAVYAREIAATTRRLGRLTQSVMRCQIAMTLIALQEGIEIRTLATEYNASNHLDIMAHNGLTADRIRVLHYQVEDEITREELQPALIDAMLSRTVTIPANVALQQLARAYRETLR